MLNIILYCRTNVNFDDLVTAKGKTTEHDYLQLQDLENTNKSTYERLLNYLQKYWNYDLTNMNMQLKICLCENYVKAL